MEGVRRCTCRLWPSPRAVTLFRAYRRARVYEVGGTGVTSPPIALATVAGRPFSQLDPEAPPGDRDEDGARSTVATISGSTRDPLQQHPPPPPPQSSPGASRSPRGAMPTLLEKVHRYVWPKEREECPQVAFEQQPCKEIPITQWIIRRVRRLSFFHKKKGKCLLLDERHKLLF